MARQGQRPHVVDEQEARPAAAPAPETGDLFAHFGVALEPRGARGPRPLVEVVACSHCGWWLSAAGLELHAPCPLCGTPS